MSLVTSHELEVKRPLLSMTLAHVQPEHHYSLTGHYRSLPGHHWTPTRHTVQYVSQFLTGHP